MNRPSDLRIRLRLLVDPGVFISALISPNGAPSQLVQSAVAGRVTLVVSPALLDELANVLHRKKFRRWFSDEDADDFITAITLLGESAPDPSREHRRPLCRDPKDEYLLALAETADVSFLVSGDSDLLDITSGTVIVRNPAESLEILNHDHPWGTAFAPARDDEIERRIEAEGNDKVLECAGTFLTIVGDPAFIGNLRDVVTPESLPHWLTSIDVARAALTGRGLSSRPEYPAPDVAYVRWTEDPGESIMATNEVMIKAVVMTLQRRPELPPTGIGSHLDFDGWRVHALGDYYPVEKMPTP